jgi:hypothetical protein
MRDEKIAFFKGKKKGKRKLKKGKNPHIPSTGQKFATN